MKKLITVLAMTLVATLSAQDASAAKCRVKLKNGRGVTLEKFVGHGYRKQDACQDAQRQCRRVKNGGYYRARVLRCEKVDNIVTKTCRADLYGKRGRVVKTFVGSAVGQSGSGVKAQACKKALNRCVSDRHGLRVGYCRAENGEIRAPRATRAIGRGIGRAVERALN